MKLRFSIFPEDLRQREAEIVTAITTAVPGSSLSMDQPHGLLYVSIPRDVEPALAGDKICRALSAIGIGARLMVEGPAWRSKRSKTVSMPIFVTSLIAVALAVALLTFFLTGAFSVSFSSMGLGFNETTLGTGKQEGENYAGKIALVDRIFEQYSLYDTDGELLLDEMLRAYAQATGDTYAAYYTEEEFKQMMDENNASLVGIGITAIEDSVYHDILIISVLPNSPALAAGLQAGDRITHIGIGEQKQSVSAMGYEAALGYLKGAEGTKAEFVVARGDSQMEFSIARAVVELISVTGTVSATNNKVGIVRISQFDLKTPVQFKTVMNDLISKGCESFVFDVRNNPGGDLKSISAVLSYFLKADDLITSTVSKDGTTTEYKVRKVTYKDDYAPCSVAADEIGMYRQYKMAVLTNQNTASAAELFTAALKDYDLATVVGKTTYGKGVLQNIISLESFGYKGAVKLTTGYYSPPSGVNYDGKGIAPDLEIALSEAAAGKNLYLLSEAEDDQLLAAIQSLIS